MLSIENIKEGVAAAAAEYPVEKVELFGSYADGTNTPESDVDLLVWFQRPRVSLLTISGMKIRLEELLHTPVDIVHAPVPSDSLLEIKKKVPVYGA